MIKTRLSILALTAALGLSTLASTVSAQTTNSVSRPQSRDTYSSEEMMATGHQFFGKTTRGLAEAIEYVFRKQGEPSAYIVGEEGAGAFVGGLRYGEGTIYYKSGVKKHIFWQGPSVGFDFGGNGSRTLTLVYNSQSPEDLYTRFAGVEGTAATAAAFGALAAPTATPAAASVAAGLDAAGAGRGWFFPANGALGSQSLFFLASCASLSALRGWLLFRKGTGTLVT